MHPYVLSSLTTSALVESCRNRTITVRCAASRRKPKHVKERVVARVVASDVLDQSSVPTARSGGGDGRRRWRDCTSSVNSRSIVLEKIFIWLRERHGGCDWRRRRRTTRKGGIARPTRSCFKRLWTVRRFIDWEGGHSVQIFEGFPAYTIIVIFVRVTLLVPRCRFVTTARRYRRQHPSRTMVGTRDYKETPISL